MLSSASVVTVLHRDAEARLFDAWLTDLIASAHAAPGYLDARVSEYADPALDPAVQVSFESEEQLDDWLDGPARRDVLQRGRELGCLPRADVVFGPDGLPPAGVAVFRHEVADGKEAEFVSAQAGIAAAAARFAGSEGTVLFSGGGGQWLSVLRFRRASQLTRWLNSGDRLGALPAVRASLSRNFTRVSLTTGFGSTVRTEDGTTSVTPGWKAAMLVVLVLYPTVMLLSRFFGPLLDELGAPPWLAFFVSNIVSVAALQWLLMPVMSRIFRRWLDPVDGAGLRVSLTGAAVIVLGYLATLALFAVVKDLQFWDYVD